MILVAYRHGLRGRSDEAERHPAQSHGRCPRRDKSVSVATPKTPDGPRWELRAIRKLLLDDSVSAKQE
jgi:hypothetical protein